jgi:tellurite resistance protein
VTKSGAAGLVEGNCPNCGAPIRRSAWAKCESCGSLLRSGRHDWVLVEITQESEWSPYLPRELPGLRPLRDRDPELSVQVLEDRASVLFWRWMAALRTGDADALRGHARDECVAAVASAIVAEPDGRRTWPGECGVGRVSTLGFLAEDAHDVALAVVRWSGTRFEQRPGGRPVRGPTIPVQTALLVLERARGATSRLDEGFSSAHCPSCGAPESRVGTGACEHCGASRATPSRWVLREILDGVDAGSSLWQARLRGEAKQAEAAPALPPLRREVVDWLVAAASADGEIAPRERRIAYRLARRAGVSDAEAAALVASAAAGERARGPASPAEARAWFGAATEVALADGDLTAGENRLLARLAGPAGMTEAEVRRAVRDAQARLLQEAHREIRAAKSGR